MISYSQRAIRRDADRHENQLAPLSALDDRDQTGLETALHDPERTELSSTAEALQISWSKRLEELSRRTVTSSVSSLDGEAAQSIHHHLDALERILRTPNTDFVQRDELSRHESGSLESVDSDMSQLESVEQVPEKIFQNVATMSDQKDDIKKKDVQLQLNSVMTEVTALNKEINKRRNESNEIKDLFEERCRGLTRTVAELEDELLEL